MRITFLLPGSGEEPVGGFKVVYEYAGGLAARGHTVTILHPAGIARFPSLRSRSRRWGRFLLRRATGRFGPRTWFRLDPRVRVLWSPTLDSRYVPDGDAVVATAWETAEWAAGYPSGKGRKFYLIQHLETWSGPEDRVRNTWRLPLVKVVIARWLQDLAQELGEHAVCIPNGLDFIAFGMDVPPEQRSPHTLIMMYQTYPWKGSEDGMVAAAQLKKEFPDLGLTLFGVPRRPREAPEWAVYHRSASQSELRALYNRSAIFLGPSRSEGWALPPAEAAACGAALAVTDIGGHRDYAIQDETALLSPPRRPDLLAANVRRLIHDSPLRIRLARAGHIHMGQFTWDRALDRFEGVLQETVHP